MPIYSSPQSPPTATADSPGAMSAAEHNKLLTIPAGGWLNQAAIDAINAAAPGVSMCIPIDIRNWPISSTAERSYVSGPGGLGELGGGTNFKGGAGNVLTTDLMVNHIQAQPWAVRWRQRFHAPATSQYFYLGVGWSNLAEAFIVAHQYDIVDVKGFSHTKLLLEQNHSSAGYIDSGTPGWVIDGLIHTFMLAGNPSAGAASGVTLYVDDVPVAVALFSDNRGPTGTGQITVMATGQYNPIMDMAYAV